VPRIRRGGKRIRGSNGGRTRNEDCCCADEPEEVTGNCNGRTITFPSFFVVDYGAVGSYDDSTPPACDICDTVGGVRELRDYTLSSCGAVAPGFCTLQYLQSLGTTCGLNDSYSLRFDIPCSGTGNIFYSISHFGASVAATGSISFTTNLMGFTATASTGSSSICDVHPGTLSVL
jgi:hypothetical protein